MSGRGKFSGFKWHHEFHTIEPKKEKASDCIFLSEQRECQNKDSSYYLSKCFIATICPHRVKSEIQDEDQCLSAQKPLKRIKYNCSLPIGCVVVHKKYGEGRIIRFDQKDNFLWIQFAEKSLRFRYPNAFVDKFLSADKSVQHLITKDINEAEEI